MFRVTIVDRAGRESRVEVAAADEAAAREAACPGDARLCRNPFVVLESVPEFDRQIVSVEEV